MGPLHILQRAEKCGWDTNNGEVVNESLSTTVAELDLILERGGAGSFQTSLFTALQSYVLKTADGS